MIYENKFIYEYWELFIRDFLFSCKIKVIVKLILVLMEMCVK